MTRQKPTASPASHTPRYLRGATPLFSFRGDPRFGYCLYVPAGFDNEPQTFELLVLVHGTSRTLMSYRDGFRDFARANNHILLAPLFPVGPLGDDNVHGYKILREQDLRYDLILLAMIEEVAVRLGRNFDRFKLFGFSGGGQFSQRFSLIHPERLSAVAIGAPGSITLLDSRKPWFVGTGNCEAIYGKSVDLEMLGKVPTQIVVGAADNDSSDIFYPTTSVQFMEGINDSGKTRVERARRLLEIYEDNGIDVRFDLVEGCAHNAAGVFPAVQDFFSCLPARQASPTASLPS